MEHDPLRPRVGIESLLVERLSAQGQVHWTPWRKYGSTVVTRFAIALLHSTVFHLCSWWTLEVKVVSTTRVCRFSLRSGVEFGQKVYTEVLFPVS